MGILKYTPGDLCSRIPLYLPWFSGNILFLLESHDQWSIQYSNRPRLLICSIKEPKKVRYGSINFQLNGVIAYSLMKASLPWELRLLDLQSPKLWGQEAKIISSGIYFNSKSYSHFYLLIYRPVNPGYGRNIYQSLRACRASSMTILILNILFPLDGRVLLYTPNFVAW